MTKIFSLFGFFNNLSSIQKSLVVSIVSIVLFLGVTGASYSLFSKARPGGSGSLVTSLPSPSAAVTEEPNEPRTESCPLNGALHTKTAKDNWATRRPLAIMVENHTESRPQSGLSSADIVYEAVAEGGITRFMGVFLCNLSDIQVGPIRSARTYFLDWLAEYDALYAHVGGANTPGPADALGQIIKYGVKDLNQFSIGFPTFWRDYQRLGRSVATEHTMYSTTQKLWAVGAQRGWTVKDVSGKTWESQFVSWKFKDPAPAGAGQVPVSNINVEFWQGYADYAVNWSYDGTCDCYKRKNGGTPHTDLNNKQQLSVKNIVVQFQKESRANDGYENNVHLLYGTTGTGKALIFQDGKVIEGKWVKTSRTARSKYVDGRGSEISFNKGVIWIETVPEGARVSY